MHTLLIYQVKLLSSIFSFSVIYLCNQKYLQITLLGTGVRFPGLTHPGIIGTAPSVELLNIWNKRERELEETGHQSMKLCEVLHTRPLANLPSTKGCHLGKVFNNHLTY